MMAAVLGGATGCEAPRAFVAVSDPEAQALIVAELKNGAVAFLAAHDPRANGGLVVEVEDDEAATIVAFTSRCSLETLGLGLGLLSPVEGDAGRTFGVPVHQAFRLPRSGGSAEPVATDGAEVQVVVEHLPIAPADLCRAQSVGFSSQEASFPIDLVPGYPASRSLFELPDGRVGSALESHASLSERSLLDHGVWVAELLAPPVRQPGLGGLTVVELRPIGDELLIADAAGPVYRGTLTGTTTQLFDVGPNTNVTFAFPKDSSFDGPAFGALLVHRADRYSWLATEDWGPPRLLRDLSPNATLTGPVSLPGRAIGLIVDDVLLLATASGLEERELPIGAQPVRLQVLDGQMVLIDFSGRSFVFEDDHWRERPFSPSFAPDIFLPLGAGRLAIGSASGVLEARRVTARGWVCSEDRLPLPPNAAGIALRSGRVLHSELQPGTASVRQLVLESDGAVPDPCFAD